MILLQPSNQLMLIFITEFFFCIGSILTNFGILLISQTTLPENTGAISYLEMLTLIPGGVVCLLISIILEIVAGFKIYFRKIKYL